MPRVRMIAVCGLAALAGAVCLLAAGQQGLVDWRAVRAIVIESDDWGLAGFVPDAEAWAGLRREDLDPGRFPAVYWNSTLEDSSAVADLAGILGARRGRDGLPAVLQPNYIMSALAWEDGQWRRYDLPALPRAYRRPGLWTAVAEAERAGVWHPEYHGAWHYDPELRRRATTGAPGVAAAAARGIMLFPGSEAARELGPWRPTPLLAAELDSALAVFERGFGRRPGSIIAPDYTWDARTERLWEARGLTVIQAKREQRHPRWPAGVPGRVLKVLERQWSKACRPRRAYLERNCRLEPVQSPDARSVVDVCVRDTHAAWRRGEPAIVESHRVNFAHADAGVAAAGRLALGQYLDAVMGPGDAGPVFLVDAEVAALTRRGASVRREGDRTFGRNGTHTRRLADAGGREVPGGRTASIWILDAGFSGAVPASGSR